MVMGARKQITISYGQGRNIPALDAPNIVHIRCTPRNAACICSIELWSNNITAQIGSIICVGICTACRNQRHKSLKSNKWLAVIKIKRFSRISNHLQLLCRKNYSTTVIPCIVSDHFIVPVFTFRRNCNGHTRSICNRRKGITPILSIIVFNVAISKSIPTTIKLFNSDVTSAIISYYTH